MELQRDVVGVAEREHVAHGAADDGAAPDLVTVEELGPALKFFASRDREAEVVEADPALGE